MIRKTEKFFCGHRLWRNVSFQSFSTKIFVDFEILKKFAEINFQGTE